MPILKPIAIKDVPPAKKLGAKESAVPEILKQCVKGQALPIVNIYKKVKADTPTGEPSKWKTTDEPRITTIRSYITKMHKKGQLKNFNMEQRLEHKDGTKIITLYVIKE